VVVYRLVTCGTVEEKIYRKQVFKGGLSKAGMEDGIQLRYQELSKCEVGMALARPYLHLASF
jgi:SNF2 family DNA or RNA helicase